MAARPNDSIGARNVRSRPPEIADGLTAKTMKKPEFEKLGLFYALN